MAGTIKVRIQGSGDDGSPSADDLVDQLRDYLDILEAVEAAHASDDQNAIVWRVVEARRFNPFEFTLHADSRVYATDVSRRAAAVARRFSEGMNALKSTPARPPFFTDGALKKAQQTFHRVTNGLNLSEIEFDDVGVPDFRVTPVVARSAEKNAQLALKPVDKPYKEFGTIEGVTRGADVDGHGRRLLYVRHRLTGDIVKCVLSGDALAKIGAHTVAEIYLGIRVRVQGVIRFNRPGHIFQVDANDVVYARPRHELPTVDDILDEGFTGGLRTEEYLERIRDAGLHS